MNAPREFHNFCSRFHQDAFLVSERIEDAIEAALKQFDDRQRKVLEEFISGLMTSEVSDAELSRLFSSSGADFYLRGARRFFSQVLKKLSGRSD